MAIIPIAKVLLTALRPRRPIWALPLSGGLIAMVLSFVFDPTLQNNLPNLLMSLGGWLLTLSGILFAGNQAARIALSEAFSRLYQDEASTEQYSAKKLVSAFGKTVTAEKNRYASARILMNSYATEKQTELHEARRRLTSYWVLAEAYYESHLMTPSEVFAIAGSPEILLYLEPLEVLAAESMGIPMKTGPWPTMHLLKKWYLLNKNRKEATKIGTHLPLYEELYKSSIG